MTTTLDTLKALCRKVAGDDFFDGCRDESHEFCVLNWIDEQADDPTHLGSEKAYTLRYMAAAFRWYGIAVSVRRQCLDSQGNN